MNLKTIGLKKIGLGNGVIRKASNTPAEDLITMDYTAFGERTLSLGGTGDVTVNWGDGSSETVTLTEGVILIEHEFNGSGILTISNPSIITYIKAYGFAATYVTGLDKCINITYISFANNLFTYFSTYATWTKLKYLQLNGNNLLESIETFVEWVDIEHIYLNNVSISTLATFASWTKLLELAVNGTLLTSLETHAEWIYLDWIDISNTAITSLQTFAIWGNFEYLYASNSALTSLVTFSEWIYLYELFCDGCALNEASVNNILIEAIESGVTGATIDLSGGTNAAPTGAGIVAYNALLENNSVYVNGYPV